MLGFRFFLALGLGILYQILITSAGNAVPVLYWGRDASASAANLMNPLVKTSQEEFEKILSKKVGGARPPALVFVRDNLCVEDLKQHSESLAQLNKKDGLLYLPAVDSPLPVFEELYSENYTTTEKPESISEGELVVTDASDLDSILEIYKTVQKSTPNLIAALTGKSCSYSYSERTRRRAKRETTPSKDSSEFIVSKDRVLLYSSEFPYLQTSASEPYVQLGAPTEISVNGSGTRTSPLRLILQYSINATDSANPKNAELSMIFAVESAGYYMLSTVEYEIEGSEKTTLTINKPLVFPFNFSYHCSQESIFRSNSVNFKFTNLQVQIDAKAFGDAYDCVGFTSIPIWTGIFVTAILAIIMIWGLAMILDIRTMDRFDDPKGKTITISAQE